MDQFCAFIFGNLRNIAGADGVDFEGQVRFVLCFIDGLKFLVLSF